jgi:hypothetical protein
MTLIHTTHYYYLRYITNTHYTLHYNIFAMTLLHTLTLHTLRRHYDTIYAAAFSHNIKTLIFSSHYLHRRHAMPLLPYIITYDYYYYY